MADEKTEKKKKSKRKKTFQANDTVSKPDVVPCEPGEVIAAPAENEDATPQVAQIIENTEKIAEAVKADAIACCICGAFADRKKAIMVGNQYVCSKSCMKKYAIQRPRF